MTDEKKFGYYDSVDEYLDCLPVTMDVDEPIGLYTIPGDGIETFGFNGPDLIHFVSCCLITMLGAGGIPCIPGYPNHPVDWVYEPKYGTTSEEIHDNVLNEWIANGAGPLEFWTGPWFGLPKSVHAVSK